MVLWPYLRPASPWSHARKLLLSSAHFFSSRHPASEQQSARISWMLSTLPTPGTLRHMTAEIISSFIKGFTLTFTLGPGTEFPRILVGWECKCCLFADSACSWRSGESSRSGIITCPVWRKQSWACSNLFSPTMSPHHRNWSSYWNKHCWWVIFIAIQPQMYKAYPEFIIWMAQSIYSQFQTSKPKMKCILGALCSALILFVNGETKHVECKLCSFCWGNAFEYTVLTCVSVPFRWDFIFLPDSFHTIWLCSPCVSHHLANAAVCRTSFGLHGTWSLCNWVTV